MSVTGVIVTMLSAWDTLERVMLLACAKTHSMLNKQRIITRGADKFYRAACT